MTTECHSIVVKLKQLDLLTCNVVAVSEDTTLSMIVACAPGNSEEAAEMVARVMARALEWKWKDVRRATLAPKGDMVYLLPKG